LSAQVDALDIPVFICSRDRVSCLRRLVEWLEKAGHQRIVILDNASTYPPLLDYLDASPHTVVHLGRNLGKRAIWLAGLAPNEAYVYTDPDIVPTEHCPLDAVAVLKNALDTHPYPKAGLGLYLDDFPATLDPDLVTWERGHIIRGEDLGGVYVSAIDTTFALYRPGGEFAYQGVRTHAPYEARHLGWYAEAEPSEEDLYYLAHADAGTEASSWKTRACR
jgi:hypothetical protein